MASRTNVTSGINIARLNGTARYHLQHHTPRDEALDALREVGATPEQVRDAAAHVRDFFADRHPIEAQQARDVADLLEELL